MDESTFIKLYEGSTNPEDAFIDVESVEPDDERERQLNAFRDQELGPDPYKILNQYKQLSDTDKGLFLAALKDYTGIKLY